jgi:hypothetical protein
MTASFSPIGLPRTLNCSPIWKASSLNQSINQSINVYLPGGGEHKGKNAVRIFAQFLQNWKSKGCCFAASCFGTSDAIMA